MLNIDLTAELRWWLAILRTADRLNGQLPEAMRQEIEAGACDRELGRMAVHMAAMSTPTRRKVEQALLAILAELGDDSLASSRDVVPLRLVGQAVS